MTALKNYFYLCDFLKNIYIFNNDNIYMSEKNFKFNSKVNFYYFIKDFDSMMCYHIKSFKGYCAKSK